MGLHLFSSNAKSGGREKLETFHLWNEWLSKSSTKVSVDAYLVHNSHTLAILSTVHSICAFDHQYIIYIIISIYNIYNHNMYIYIFIYLSCRDPGADRIWIFQDNLTNNTNMYGHVFQIP